MSKLPPVYIVDIEGSVYNKDPDDPDGCVGSFTGNPYHPKNIIVAYGERRLSAVIPNLFHTKGVDISTLVTDRINAYIEEGACIVGCNLSYDLAMIYKTICLHTKSIDLWYDFLKECTIWDIQIADYYLSGLQNKMRSLDDMGEPLGHAKLTAVKEYWGAGYDTEDIPSSVLLEYLDKDINVTEAVYTHQLAQLSTVDMSVAIRLANAWRLFTIAMEINGLYIRKPVFDSEKLKAEMAADLLKSSIKNDILMLHSELPEEIVNDLNIDSNDVQSLVLFGGTLETDSTEFVTDDAGLPVPYKTGPRKGQLKTKKCKIKHYLDSIVPIKYTSSTVKPGTYQVSNDVLKAIANDTDSDDVKDYITVLMQRREVNKALNTYYKGWAKHIWPRTSLIHTSYNHTVTNTSRLSSSSPNLQNISNKDYSTFSFGDCITPRILSYNYVKIDFKQLEVYCQAILANEPNLLRQLKYGVDIHTQRAQSLFVTSTVTKEMRDLAKGMSFMLAYGSGPKNMADKLGVSLRAAKKFIDDFYKDYPNIKAYEQHVMNRVTATMTSDKDTWNTYRGIYDEPRTGVRYTFVFDSPRPPLTKIKNYPVQGFAGGSIVPLFGVCLHQEMLKNPYLNDRICIPVLTVHDDFIIEVPASSCESFYNRVIIPAHNKFTKLAKHFFNVTITLPIEVQVGSSLSNFALYRSYPDHA